MPRRVFLQPTPETIPYSDRKAMGNAVAAWPLKNVVYAQRRACEGATIAEIARELMLAADEVSRVLNAEPKTERPALAGVARARWKPQRSRRFV
jgi:hypothetical protein